MDNQLPEPILTPVEPKLPTTNPPWFWPVIIAMGVFVLIFAGFITWTLSMQKPAASYPQQQTTAPAKSQQPSAMISGQIFFDGYASSGAQLIVSARQVGTENAFTDVATNIQPLPITPWTWKGAQEGKNYELQVSLRLNGKTLEQSAPITVSTPATNANIRLVSEQQPTLPQTSSISGAIDLKGYVASGSSVTILAKSVSAAVYGPVATAAATDNASWKWNGASTGTTYDLKAQIQDSNGTIISNQSPLLITAPSGSQTLLAQSVATPSSSTIGSIAGIITLNGVVPPNSHITLATRKTGTQAFTQVLNNISATSNVSWVWGFATVGTSYDIQAILWSNNKQVASSEIVTTTAPSALEVLTINAQIPIAQPILTSFSASCGTRQGDSIPASVTYNTQSNLSTPLQYNVLITTAANGKKVASSVTTPPNPSQSQTFISGPVLTPGTIYFVQYAYAQCTNCGTFTPLSQPIQLLCE